MSRSKSLESGSEENDSPLRRWSERKLQSRQDATAPAPEEPAVEPAATTEPPLTDVDMPKLESLSGESDYSGFLSPGVSEELRRLALRQLFRASQFNVRDGLDDYDEDFTSFAKLGDTITSDLRHRWEMQRRKAAAEGRDRDENTRVEATTEQPADDGRDEPPSDEEMQGAEAAEPTQAQQTHSDPHDPEQRRDP